MWIHLFDSLEIEIRSLVPLWQVIVKFFRFLLGKQSKYFTLCIFCRKQIAKDNVKQQSFVCTLFISGYLCSKTCAKCYFSLIIFSNLSDRIWKRMLDKSSVVSCGGAMWSHYASHLLKWIQAVVLYFPKAITTTQNWRLSYSRSNFPCLSFISQPFLVFNLHLIMNLSSFKLAYGWKTASCDALNHYT